MKKKFEYHEGNTPEQRCTMDTTAGLDTCLFLYVWRVHDVQAEGKRIIFHLKNPIKIVKMLDIHVAECSVQVF